VTHALGNRPGRDGAAHSVARVERGVGILKHHLDLTAFGVTALAHIGGEGVTIEQDLTVVFRNQAGKATPHGGLTRTRFAHHAQCLALAQGEAEVVGRMHRARGREPAATGSVSLVQAPDFEQRRGGGTASRQTSHAFRNGGDQALRIGMLRGVQHVLRGTALDQLAGLHHSHLVGDLRHHSEVVGDEQHRHAFAFLQFLHQGQNLGLGGHIQRGGRLIGDQQCGLQKHRGSDHDALALPTRKAEGVAVQQLFGVGQADVAQCRDDALAFLAARQIGPMAVQNLLDLLANAHHRVERGHGLLKDHADAPSAQLSHARLAGHQQILALEHDLAGHGTHVG